MGKDERIHFLEKLEHTVPLHKHASTKESFAN